MQVGIPRETKNREYRVALTPAGAHHLVAAGHAVLVVPQSVARLHLRKGLTTRPVPDAPGSAVALAWLQASYDDLTEELIGIVRGRTANSSRGRRPAPAPPPKKHTPPKKPPHRRRH